MPLFIILLLVFFTILPSAAGPSSKLQPASKIEYFFPDGYSRSSNKKLPCLVILHGSGGLDPGGGFFRELAKALTSGQRVCALVHYMDCTGHTWASAEDMGRYFSIWMKTVNQSVSEVRREPFVNSAKVSLLGHSLGAQLALHDAAIDPDIVSVVDMSGCFVLPTANVRRMPPVLILHGANDQVVPLRREHQLKTVLAKSGGRFEEHIFPKADHAFNNVPFELLSTTIAEFLNQVESPH